MHEFLPYRSFTSPFRRSLHTRRPGAHRTGQVVGIVIAFADEAARFVTTCTSVPPNFSRRSKRAAPDDIAASVRLLLRPAATSASLLQLREHALLQRTPSFSSLACVSLEIFAINRSNSERH